MDQLSLNSIDEWTDEELLAYASRSGPGMFISTATTIWSLDPDERYTGYQAAIDRGFEGKKARAIANTINSAKCRKGLCLDNGRGEGVLYWSDTGMVLGSHLKSMIVDNGRVHDGKAMIRITLAPRLASGLMRLARRAPEQRRNQPEAMTGKYGLIKRVDSMPPLDLRVVVRLLERRKGLEIPPIWNDIKNLSRVELWEIIAALGFEDARDAYRETAKRISAMETIGVADVVEPLIDAAGKLADKGRSAGREVGAAADRAVGKVGEAARDAAARIKAAPEQARSWSRNAVDAVSRRFRINRQSPRARVLVFALCFGLAVAGVGAASVVVREPGYILHVLKTKGATAALNAFPAYFFDSAATQREKFEYAWAHYRNHGFERSEEIIRDLLNNDPTQYTQACCFYLLGLINRQLGEHLQSVGLYTKAIKYYEGFPESIELVKIEKARSFTYLGLIDLAEEQIQTIEGLSLANQEKALEIRANIALDKKEYSKALSFSEIRYTINMSEGNLLEAGYSLTHVGYYQFLLGKINDSIHSSLKAQAIALDLGDKELGFFAQINLIAIRRCQNQEYLDLTKQVESWSVNNNRLLLLDFLKRALSRACFSDS